ncbi:hypothetical protein BC777_0841 [Yoonia maricola]|uniref:Uncharacterized protein n=2 Tax=Yoonia maricola TaxID=420999 RepID=A0A2M8WM52_9RHOB|nr:hypothetical protein BC777_0841 [Yoonia maricola]
MITFDELLKRLQSQDPIKPLVFITADGEIGAGYHVTELRHSISKGIDCGGSIETWEDAKLQLLDGPGSTHMTVGKFTNIIQKSLSALPELRNTPLMVEFGHNNEQLVLMSLHGPEVSDETVALSLGDVRAVCKPAVRRKRDVEDQGGCCGTAIPSPQKSSCCDAVTATQDATACCT